MGGMAYSSEKDLRTQIAARQAASPTLDAIAAMTPVAGTLVGFDDQTKPVSVAAAAARLLLGLGPMALESASNWQRRRYANPTIPAGNTVANTAVETAYASTYTIPANSLAAGDEVAIELWGVFSTAAIIPTLRGKVFVGGQAVLDTGALTGLTMGTNLAWSGFATMLVLSTGAAGVIDVQGQLIFSTGLGTALTVGLGNAGTYTVNTTTALAVSSSAKWSVAGSANSIQLRRMVVR